MARAKSGNLEGDDYRKGALERLDDAFILLRSGQFSGSASDAGRAVEGMLRAVIWKRDIDVRSGKKSLDTGHDLRELLTRVRDLGLLTPATTEPDELEIQVLRIARLWFDNMRFASSKFVETRWVRLGEVRKGNTLKHATSRFYYACSRIVKRCEVICQR